MANVLEKKRILIVDDESAMLEIVKSVLKRVEAEPIGTNSFERGLKLARSQAFDAIILDRYMPDGDGHDILKALKDNEQTAKTPVVMLTGEKDMQQVKLSLSLGAVGYIVKPFTPKSFLGQLNKILENQFKIDM